MIKVSVIVPVYNVYDYLEKCLDSLVNQTLKEIEIIVVNDGSPDNSEEIIARYAKDYPEKVKAYKKENGGLSDARNYGIKKAKGEYIGFVDSDDYVDTKMYEKLYNKAKNDKLDIVLCDTINLYEDGKEVLVKSNLHYTDDVVKNYLLSPPMAWLRLYKRELFNDLEFKKGIYYEDLELMPRMVKYTKKIGFLDEGLYYYLQRSGSIMKQKEFNNKLLDIFSVLELNKKVLSKEYPEEIEYMYITHLLRTATLRFLEYQGTQKYLDEINLIIRNNYPNWKKNIYLKKASKKTKIISYLAYSKCYGVLKLIKKITNK